MSELLAPAGSMEALKAAVANGCDAVYLGMKKYGARAYSSNFDEESLEEAVAYAHLRGVRVYVTVNTIVFEAELEDVFGQLRFLNGIGVDGVIVQDLALLDFIVRHFEDMEAHCSTQMGVDDLDGALLCKELGARRVVLSREVDIEKVRDIRRQADVPVEIFVHGALCVSYSGNCIMSGMTGNRSGNRGRCIGSCRKLYDVVELGAAGDAAADCGGAAMAGAAAVTRGSAAEDAGASGAATCEKRLGRSYILSTKDLNTIEHAGEFAGIDSLKIEGRMKEPVYVANVVSRYRMALDGEATREDKEKLNRTFNRTYTEGYLFGEDRKRIVNTERPNHSGYRVGKVAGFRRGMYELSLTRPLKQNDLIRIRHDGEDVNLSLARIYDRQGRLVNGAEAGEPCFIKVKERLSAGDAVFKTKDVAYERELEARLGGEFRRFPLNVVVRAYPGAPLFAEAEAFGIRCSYEGEEPLSEAVNQPTTQEAVRKQLDRLNDTVFFLNEVEYESCNAFVPAKQINAARKELVRRLGEGRLAAKKRRLKPAPSAAESGALVSAGTGALGSAGASAAAGAPAAPHLAAPVCFEPQKPYLTAFATTQEQYEACLECGLKTVYFRNFAPRNGFDSRMLGEAALGEDVLVGGLGGVRRYGGTGRMVADYSLNVVNSRSCRELHRLGARRVTMSYEINEGQLHDLLAAYRAENGGSPALEMVVYGHAPLLVTKYCPLKTLGQCGRCRTKRYEIRDEFGSFPVVTHENCDTTVLNGKVLNLLDEMPRIKGVEAFRLNFTVETAEEVRAVVARALGKLDGSLAVSAFNPETDTRGYFNKEIL